ASRPRLSSLSSVLGSRYTSPGSWCTSEAKRVTQNAPATVRTRTTATSGSATRRARREALSTRGSVRVTLAPPVVDAKLRARRLRDLLAHPASPVAARILARVVPALDDAPEDVRVFFEAMARLAPVLSTVRGLARHLRICPSTLMSRFYRVGLPSPKTYLAGM